MKIMSFNCRGLAGPIKKSAFRRVLTLEHPDVILLQETLGIGDEIKTRLECWLPGWVFVTLDVRGRSGGLAVGWNERHVKMLNSWGMESAIGMHFLGLEPGENFTVVNIYGPYINRIPLWESLLMILY